MLLMSADPKCCTKVKILNKNFMNKHFSPNEKEIGLKEEKSVSNARSNSRLFIKSYKEESH